MNFRRLRLIAEALFWVPLAVVVSTALHFVKLLGDLIAAFRAEWDMHAWGERRRCPP